MSGPDDSDATKIDAKDAARKIEDAGVADETAAYTDAVEGDGDDEADGEARAGQGGAGGHG